MSVLFAVKIIVLIISAQLFVLSWSIEKNKFTYLWESKNLNNVSSVSLI